MYNDFLNRSVMQVLYMLQSCHEERATCYDACIFDVCTINAPHQRQNTCRQGYFNADSFVKPYLRIFWNC